MERAYREPTSQLRRLSDLSDYDVADNRPDVRGWTVDDLEGRSIAKVNDLVVDTGSMTARYLELKLDRKAVHLDRDKHVIVPVEDAHLDRDNKRIYVAGLTSSVAAALPEFTGAYEGAGYETGTWDKSDTGAGRRDAERLTRAEEELRIGKRTHEGELRVRKHVETEHVREDVPLRREEPYVERRPVAPGEEMRAAEISEDEVRIPIVEEEAVVEKRPVVKEELVVGKQTSQDTKQVDTDVRRERVDVDRSDLDERDPNLRKR